MAQNPMPLWGWIFRLGGRMSWRRMAKANGISIKSLWDVPIEMERKDEDEP
jgi:hypothetical protein